MKKEVFVVTTIILQLLIAAVNAIITTPPTDASVCYGGLATFHCGSDRNDIANIQWHITPDDLSLQEREISIDTTITSEYATSTLSIIGAPVYNEISAACTAITSSFVIDTVSALLTVYDIPPVGDLNIEFNDTVMTITWSEPSCLPVNYTYSITITDDNNQTLTTNTTDPLYTMPVWSNCTTNYTVSVTVIDTGYTHKQSVPSVGNKTRNNTEEVYVQLLKRELVFSDVYLSYVNVTFKINTSCNERPIQDIFIEHVQPVNNIRMVHLLEYVDEETNSGNYFTDNFDERFLGNLSISPTNDSRVSTIDISTFNVQDLFVANEARNGSVVITCVFATNSSADGCNVTVQSSRYYTFIVIQKEEDENHATNEILLPEEGLYSFQVFDIVGGHTDALNAAVSMSKNISFNVDNTSEINDDYTSTSFSISESITATFSSTQLLTTIGVSNVGSSISFSVIIAGVGSVVISVLLFISFVLFLTTRRHLRKKGDFDTRKKQVIIRIYETDGNEYIERQSFVDVSVSADTSLTPVTAQSTQQHEEGNVIAQSTQQNNDDNPYHESRNDFLHRAKPLVEIDSDCSNRIIPLASNQETHSENFELVVNQDSIFSSDLSHHFYSNTKSLNGKQSSSPYENIPPKHRYISNDSATDQGSTTKLNHSVPAGPMLDKSQYAELASNTQRPQPPISDPPPVYSSIIPTCVNTRMTMNLSQSPEKEKPIPKLSVIEKAQDNSVVDHKHTDSATANGTVPTDEDMYSVAFSVEPHSPDMAGNSEFAIEKGLSGLAFTQEEECVHESVNTNNGVYALNREKCKRNQLPGKKCDRLTTIGEAANDGRRTSYSIFPEQCTHGEKDHKLDD